MRLNSSMPITEKIFSLGRADDLKPADMTWKMPGRMQRPLGTALKGFLSVLSDKTYKTNFL